MTPNLIAFRDALQESFEPAIDSECWIDADYMQVLDCTGPVKLVDKWTGRDGRRRAWFEFEDSYGMRVQDGLFLSELKAEKWRYKEFIREEYCVPPEIISVCAINESTAFQQQQQEHFRKHLNIERDPFSYKPMIGYWRDGQELCTVTREEDQLIEQESYLDLEAARSKVVVLSGVS